MEHSRNDQGAREVPAKETRSRRAGGDREGTRGHELRLYLSLNSLNEKRLPQGFEQRTYYDTALSKP